MLYQPYTFRSFTALTSVADFHGAAAEFSNWIDNLYSDSDAYRTSISELSFLVRESSENSSAVAFARKIEIHQGEHGTNHQMRNTAETRAAISVEYTVSNKSINEVKNDTN